MKNKKTLPKTEKESAPEISGLPVINYELKISRQVSINERGVYRETAGLLYISVPPVSINGKTVSSFEILFVAVGDISPLGLYNGGRISLQMPEKDLINWLSGFQAPFYYLDYYPPEPEMTGYFPFTLTLIARNFR